MERPPEYRLAALAGAGSVLTGAVGSSLSDYGGAGLNPGTSLELTAEYFSEHIGAARAGAGLSAAAAVLALVFAGPVRVRLGGWPGVVGAAGAVLLAVYELAGAGLMTLAVTAGEYTDGQTARMLVVAQWETARLAGVPVLAMVLAALVAGFRGRELPTWFRWLSVVFLIPLVLALVPAVGPSGALALLGTLWVVVASVFFAVERLRK